jgi:aminocarboxymuconate-semialdehyde decarboxylase
MGAKLPLTIDCHVHMLEAGVLKASENKTVMSGFGAGARNVRAGGVGPFLAKMLDPQAQLHDMDACGIDRSLVSSSTVIQGTTWAEPAADAEYCRRVNDCTAEWVARYPGRFIGSFVLPLQDVKRSLAELERSVDQLKLKVANISSNYKGVYLGASCYGPFWEQVQARDITVWIHPEGVRDMWFQDYALWNSLGQSIEEAKVMSSLIYDGVMTSFPQLKIIMAHGGGYFPHYLGRMDRNAVNRPDTLVNTNGRRPSDFLRSFYYDTCVYDPKVLKVLCERVGADRLVMGSDYPVGEKDPIGFLESAGLAGPDLAQVAGGNAARLLGL